MSLGRDKSRVLKQLPLQYAGFCTITVMIPIRTRRCNTSSTWCITYPRLMRSINITFSSTFSRSKPELKNPTRYHHCISFSIRWRYYVHDYVLSTRFVYGSASRLVARIVSHRRIVHPKPEWNLFVGIRDRVRYDVHVYYLLLCPYEVRLSTV